MDIISFNEAATANGRIEKFIENPDSNSGIVTVPKVIGAGESVTVPAGRVAVLPNVQVDGTLTIEGEVFIPTGSAINMGNGLAINGEKVIMSVPTSYHLLQGNLAVDNTVITQGFNTTLYTGNGSTQSINTGIDMATQWGNDVSEKFGGLVWIKNRLNAYDNQWYDTVRGSSYYISSNLTSAQNITATTESLTGITSTGFGLSIGWSNNKATETYASWNFQTTHRISGVTNHGKPYTCHYNPYTGFTIVKYEGSGLVGHEIPHMLGRKIEFGIIKNLTTNTEWLSLFNSGGTFGKLNASNVFSSALWGGTTQHFTEDNFLTTYESAAFIDQNAAANQYIMYGWANSYLDEANKLIGNYEVGVYQGTGAAGNKVKTRGKPAWIMIKRLDSTGNWVVFDNMRGSGNSRLFPNLSNSEGFLGDYPSNYSVRFDSDGMTFAFDDGWSNASGGQYLYMVAYDTNANGSGSYYPKSTDTANVQINNALIPIAKGSDINGLKNVMLSKNESITGLTYTAGKNYIYYDGNGNKGVKSYEPRYLPSELVRRFAGEQPDYYDIEKNKWFNTDAGNELVTNGKFSSGVTTGWVAGPNVTMSVINNTLHLSAPAIAGVVKYAYTTITVAPNTNYTFIGKIVEESVATTNQFSISSTIGGFDIARKYIYGGYYNFTFNSGNNTTLYVNAELTSSSAPTAKFDGISVFPTEIIPTTEIPEGRNYLNHIVYADNDGGVLYVEELPKVKYENVIKADEFRGKNACTAWVNFDSTTTPVTIRDSYNVSAVIRVGTGIYDIYFKELMDNANYTIYGTGYSAADNYPRTIMRLYGTTPQLNKIRISHSTGNAGQVQDTKYIDVQIMGGKD